MVVGDRPGDRRQDDQRGVDPAYRPDHGQLPGRPRRARLAGDRLQPEDPGALPAAERVLLEHHPAAARPGPGLYRRRPRDLRARPGAGQRRQHRPRSTRSSSPTSRRSGRTGSARRRRARCCRPAAGSSSAGPGTAGSAPSTTRPARCCGRSRLNNAVNSLPDQLRGRRQAVHRGRGRQRLERCPLLGDADAGADQPRGGVGALGLRGAAGHGHRCQLTRKGPAPLAPDPARDRRPAPLSRHRGLRPCRPRPGAASALSLPPGRRTRPSCPTTGSTGAPRTTGPSATASIRAIPNGRSPRTSPRRSPAPCC